MFNVCIAVPTHPYYNSNLSGDGDTHIQDA